MVQLRWCASPQQADLQRQNVDGGRQEPGIGGRGRMAAGGCEVSVRDDENTKLVWTWSLASLAILPLKWIVHFEWASRMVCELYVSQ